MNEVNEKINTDELCKQSRELNLQDLMYMLKSDLFRFWSWGSNNFIVNDKKNLRMFRMTVNGYLHKGHVYIFLNGLDLFDVYLTTNRGRIVEIGSGLYNDMVANWIDRHVERK